MKKKTDTRHAGAISDMEHRELMSSGSSLLEAAKKQEKKLKKQLVRVPVLHGYVMTNAPEKWNDYNKEFQKGSNTITKALGE